MGHAVEDKDKGYGLEDEVNASEHANEVIECYISSHVTDWVNGWFAPVGQSSASSNGWGEFVV